MQKFKEGNRVRTNLRSGVWDVIEFDEKQEKYLIRQIEKHQKMDYPEPEVMTYYIDTGEMATVRNIRDITYEYNRYVSEDEIKLVPDEGTLQIQSALRLYEDEIEVLKKLDDFKGDQDYPYSIPIEEFTEGENNSIRELLYKQYWFGIGETRQFGFTEFLHADDKIVTVQNRMPKALLSLYAQ